MHDAPARRRRSILLSGATPMPKRACQRRRARMTCRKRWTLAATASGGLPASTVSKCCRARLSSPMQEEGSCKLQAHAHEVRALDQDAVEGRNGHAEPCGSRFALRQPHGLADGRHAGAKAGVDVVARLPVGDAAGDYEQQSGGDQRIEEAGHRTALMSSRPPSHRRGDKGGGRKGTRLTRIRRSRSGSRGKSAGGAMGAPLRRPVRDERSRE